MKLRAEARRGSLPSHAVIINRAITRVEVAREAATIIMLASVALLAGRNTRQRIGAFLISFACWDIFYYIFLKLLTNWPASLKTTDIYFLIPVTWVGPVITPLITSVLMLIIGTGLYSRRPTEW